MTLYCENGLPDRLQIRPCLVCGEGPCKVADPLPFNMHAALDWDKSDARLAATVPNRLHGAVINARGEAI